MYEFAKLFNTKQHGQILAIIDEGDEGPKVRFLFTPPNLGVCQQAMKFNQEDETGWDKAQTFFDSLDEEKAIEFIKPTLNLVAQAWD